MESTGVTAMFDPDSSWTRRDFVKLIGRAGLISAVPNLAHAAAVLHDVEREVRDDTVDPRPERVAGPEAVDVLVRPHECLLREVFGVVRIADDAPRDGDDSFEVFRDQVFIRFRTAGFRFGDCRNF